MIEVTGFVMGLVLAHVLNKAHIGEGGFHSGVHFALEVKRESLQLDDEHLGKPLYLVTLATLPGSPTLLTHLKQHALLLSLSDSGARLNINLSLKFPFLD